MSFDTESFIAEIKNRPCLWDSASKDYADRNLKNRCWDEIVTIFKEKDQVTKQEKKELAVTLQRKWKSIRGCYTRELNRQKALDSGSGCGPRKSEYIYFKQLKFLQNVVTIREPDPDTDTTEDPEDQLDSQLVNTPKRIRTEEKSESEDSKHLEVVYNPYESRENLEAYNEDEDRLFMLSLVNTLKMVPQHRKMATKIKIMSILDKETRSVFNIDIKCEC